MSDQLDKYEVAALRFLSEQGGGFTAGTIARNCDSGSSRSHMAVFRTWTLKRLVKLGLIERMDAEKPAVYGITDAGREALAARSAPALPRPDRLSDRRGG